MKEWWRQIYIAITSNASHDRGSNQSIEASRAIPCDRRDNFSFIYELHLFFRFFSFIHEIRLFFRFFLGFLALSTSPRCFFRFFSFKNRLAAWHRPSFLSKTTLVEPSQVDSARTDPNRNLKNVIIEGKSRKMTKNTPTNRQKANGRTERIVDLQVLLIQKN